MTVTNQNLMHGEFKNRLNLGSASYHSMQNLLSTHLPSKNITIKICRIIILPVVLYGCETCSLTLKKQNRLKVFEDRVLRIFGPMRDEIMEGWKKVSSFMI
jgi:hypothetical protein